MKNWDWITPNLCVGAGIGDIDIDALASEGVDVIFDTRAEAGDDIIRCSLKSIGYFWYKTTDSNDGTFERALPPLIKSAGKFMSNGMKIYVHCAAGVHRGPHAACAIMMACYGLSYDVAWRRIKALRPQADVQGAFVKAIKKYFHES